MRLKADRGAAVVEAGLLLAGIAAAVIGVALLTGGEIEALLTSTLEAIGRS